MSSFHRIYYTMSCQLWYYPLHCLVVLYSSFFKQQFQCTCHCQTRGSNESVWPTWVQWTSLTLQTRISYFTKLYFCCFCIVGNFFLFTSSLHLLQFFPQNTKKVNNRPSMEINHIRRQPTLLFMLSNVQILSC